MSEDRLARIEVKLDGLVTEVAELRSATNDLTIGQATVEHGFSTLGHTFDKMERDWTTVERLLVDLRSVRVLRTEVEQGFAEVLHRLDHRVAPLEDASRTFRSKLDDHEQRLAALENRRAT